MDLHRVRAHHWRHQWEVVEESSAGEVTCRCAACGRARTVHGAAARRAAGESRGFVIGF